MENNVAKQNLSPSVEYCCFIGHHRFKLPEQKAQAEEMALKYYWATMSMRVLTQIPKMDEPPPTGFPVTRYCAPVYRRKGAGKWLFFCLLKDFEKQTTQ